MFELDIAALKYREPIRLSANDRCTIWRVKGPKGPKVLKVVPAGKPYDNLLREHAFDNCMGQTGAAPAPFAVPRSRVIVHERYHILELEHLDATWCRDRPARPYQQPFDDNDLEKVYLALRHLRSVPASRLSPVLCLNMADSAYAMSIDMRSWAALADEHMPGLTARSVIEHMAAALEDRGDLAMCLNHADLAPKNMAFMSDGRLALIDAEFAEWKKRWFDPVAICLEMWAREARGAAGRRLVRYVVRRFREDGLFGPADEAQMVSVFQWYVVWMLVIATNKEKENVPNVLHAIERIRTGDLSHILAP